MRAVIVVMLFWVLAANAQQIGQNARPKENGTSQISVNTQLVVETVVVKDKKGTPIEGLTRKDFTVTEDGVPQAIAFFDHQKLPEAPNDTSASFRKRQCHDLS